jgi:hypothetical protein
MADLRDWKHGLIAERRPQYARLKRDDFRLVHRLSILEHLAHACGVKAPRMSPIAARMVSGVRATAFLEQMLELGEAC